MAIIDKPSDFFNTVLYTGNSNGSNSQTISVGMAPNWTWIKPRGATGDHRLFDTVRGVYKDLVANGTAGQANSTTSLTAFNSDGFVVGSENGVNSNNDTFVAWNWKAGTSVSGTTTGSGTGTSYTGSVNTTSGFSIIQYTGNGTSGHTIPHRLGKAPKIVQVKTISGADAWSMLNTNYDLNKYLKLNDSGGLTSDPLFNNTAPNSEVFSLDSDGQVNGNNVVCVAYCFAEIKGYSKYGQYSGNGSDNGTFVYTGFKPAFVMVKITNAGNDWIIMDNKRTTFNPMGEELKPNTSGAASTNTRWDQLSNGFKFRNTGDAVNGSGKNYIYMAFAENPIVTSTDDGSIPATAR